MESKLSSNEKTFIRNCIYQYPQFFTWEMEEAFDFCSYAWPEESCVAFTRFTKVKDICIIISTMQSSAVKKIRNTKELYYLYKKKCHTMQEVDAYLSYIDMQLYEGNAIH